MVNKKNNKRGAKVPVPQNKSDQVKVEVTLPKNNNNNKNNNSKSKSMKNPYSNPNRNVPVPVSGRWEAVDKSLAKYNENTLRDFLNSYIKQDKTYTFPRGLATPVSPNRFNFKKTITVTSASSADPLNNQIVIISRPSPEKLLSIIRNAPSVSTTQLNAEIPFRTDKQQITSQRLSVDVTLPTALGSILPEFDAKLPMSIGTNSHFLVPGGYVLPINVGSTAPSSCILGITNNSGSALTMTIYMTCYSGTLGNLTIVDTLSIQAVCDQGTTTTSSFHLAGTWATFWANCAAVGTTHLGFSVAQTVGTDPYYPVNIKFTAEIMPFTVDTGSRREDYSLFDLLPNSDILKAQYLGADSYCVTGLNLLFKNSTPVVALGGSAYAARLPGNSERDLPVTFSKISEVLQMSKNHIYADHDLRSGINFFWTPEKIQDMFFKKPGIDGGELPYGVAALTIPSSSQADFVMDLIGCISWELISYDPSLTYWTPVANAQLEMTVIAALSELNGWSQNENHLVYAAKSVKKFLQNPQVKMIMSQLVQAGVKIAPVILSMI